MDERTCVEDGCGRPRTGRSRICNHHVYLRRGGKAYAKAYADQNRERIRTHERAKRHADPEFQQRQAERARRRTPKVRERRIRDASLRRLYGITIDEYETLFAEQGGRCAVCRTVEVTTMRGWHVDHCHATGVVRGILCGTCNTGIGMLKESVAICEAAADYLAKHRGSHADLG